MVLSTNSEQLSSNNGDGTLIDNHGRVINYLRLAITDRCNLRCRYCMPAEGVDTLPHRELLSFEEMERLVRILSDIGITKVRITGGEPFARRGCLEFMQRLSAIHTVNSLHLTTNGVETASYLGGLHDLGLASINLSLDTLDRKRFLQISRRDRLQRVLATLHGALDRKIPIKINSVVIKDTADHDILALADLARQYSLSIRFIEQMPFSGGNGSEAPSHMPLRRRLQSLFSGLVPVVNGGPSTAQLYAVPGFRGTIGVIEGKSRKFCTSCNKIRITPTGMLKTCLYDDGTLNLKMLLRDGSCDFEIRDRVVSAMQNRYINGHEAEMATIREFEPSMASIGG